MEPAADAGAQAEEAPSAEAPASGAEDAGAGAPTPPHPKIDPADLFTLISRMVALLFLSSLAVMYAFSGRYAAMIPLAAVALIVQWGIIRLVNRMRAENPEYIAWRAEVEAAEREQKRARRAAAAGKGPARP